MPLPLIIGGLSAASSLIGDIFDRDAAKKAKQDAINAYTKLLIPSSETEARADRAGDTLYTKAMGELNSGAFAARGALNPETLKTIAYTKMAGSRAETEFQVGEEDYKYNKGIQQQIAQIEAQPVPTINPLNAIEAGVGGYFAGKQLDMAEDLTEAQKGFMDAQAVYYGGGKVNQYNKSIGFDPNAIPRIDKSMDNLSTNNNFFTPSTQKTINYGLDLPAKGVDPITLNKDEAIVDAMIPEFASFRKKRKLEDAFGQEMYPKPLPYFDYLGNNNRSRSGSLTKR